MQPQELETHLRSAMPDCEVRVGGDGYHFQVSVVGALFEGLNAVKRQQAVYRHMNELIMSGTVHAVTIKTYTPSEWAGQSQS